MTQSLSPSARLSEDDSNVFCGLSLLNLHVLETVTVEPLHATFLFETHNWLRGAEQFLAHVLMIIGAYAPKFREAHLIHAILSLSLSAGVIQDDR